MRYVEPSAPRTPRSVTHNVPVAAAALKGLGPAVVGSDEGLVFLLLDETLEALDLNGDGDMTDASVLAQAADMIVFVVRHNATDRDHLVKSCQQVQAINSNVAGVVLNSVDLERTYHKDYYYAAYYYEENEEGTKGARKRRSEKKAQAG